MERCSLDTVSMKRSRQLMHLQVRADGHGGSKCTRRGFVSTAWARRVGMERGQGERRVRGQGFGGRVWAHVRAKKRKRSGWKEPGRIAMPAQTSLRSSSLRIARGSSRAVAWYGASSAHRQRHTLS
jgi:hypothetical protein